MKQGAGQGVARGRWPRALVKGTKLGDVKVRAGAASRAARRPSTPRKDPMIVLARLVDPDARAVRKKYEDEVEAVIKKNSELIAKAQLRGLRHRASTRTRPSPCASPTAR